MILRSALMLAFASISLAAPATTSRPTSLITNGDFEQGLDGWDGTKDAGMSIATPEAAHRGNLGLRVTDESDEEKVGGSSLGSARVPAEPGATYEVEFWGRLMSGKGAAVYIQFFDANETALSKKDLGTMISSRLKGAQWDSYSLRGTAPDNAATVRVWVHTDNAAKVIADFDDITLLKVD